MTPIRTLLAALLLLAPVHVAAQPRPVNGIAVIVNDKVITRKDILLWMREQEDFLESIYGAQPDVLQQKKIELMEDTVNQLVEAELILHEFISSGYPLPESWVEDQIERDIRTYGDRVTLTRTLQARGITFEAYRQRLRERIIIEAMRQQFVPRDPVISPTRIEEYYNANREKFKLEDQIKLRMIVLPVPAGQADVVKSMAEEIRSKIKDGAPFEEMARIYSQGRQREDGGDWGWVERSVLRAELAETAFALQPGELGDVVVTPEACYILLVEENKPSHIRPLAEVREEIESTLKDEERNRLHQQWIDRLKKKSFIRYF